MLQKKLIQNVHSFSKKEMIDNNKKYMNQQTTSVCIKKERNHHQINASDRSNL